jgi:hypothetical protein
MPITKVCHSDPAQPEKNLLNQLPFWEDPSLPNRQVRMTDEHQSPITNH